MSLTELTVHKLGPKGDGIHLGSRGAVFLENALPGETLKARLFRDKDGVSRGETVRVLEPSRFRQKAPCRYFEDCGGCTLQHLSPDYYQHWKQEMVMEQLENNNVRVGRWLPPVFLGGANRRRGTFTAVKLGTKVVVGYYPRRSDKVTDIEECLVADPQWFSMRTHLKKYLGRLLNEQKKLDIFFQLVGKQFDMLFTGPIGRHGRPDAEVVNVISDMTKNTTIQRVSWRPRPSELPEILYKGPHPIVADFGPLKVKLPPAAFLQPTVEGEKALVNAVLSALPERGHFADLFAGSGTFSGPLLSHGTVDAYEWNRDATKLLDKAAPRELVVYRRDLFNNPLRADEANRYNAIVLDPPRSGCPEQAEELISSAVKTIVMVSCNPATFAIDAELLQRGRYRLQSVQVVDQFLWSHHVEIVGVFRRPLQNKPRRR